ncbi:putative sulfate exporter family transporter [Hassallia byssoidea VB512170]|uniref:Putative sulfate exporter family transporter n=1 Tax=Hassallia byssoidea VB512170 TaxID=1304833 RepID=A0A846HNN6_9CYAN|nr:putative sulfate exporter family transporter [Hassalia byssoidea]NEU77420.1 putative sulfate exporter family transporter [Hassalia byssoidea VB512170]
MKKDIRTNRRVHIPQLSSEQKLLYRKIVFLLAAGFCLTPWASPPIALMLGIFLALTHENPFHRITRPAAKYLLEASVIMLGFGMNLAVVLKAGASGALFAVGSISATFVLGYFLGKWLKIPIKASALISAGTAICGGSAIAAVSSVINAAESEISVAMGTVFVLNAVALFVFPPLGHALHLTQAQFGTWSGVAIHDISSVVGAASHYGQSALYTATAVKLSRALWIVPISAAASYIFQRQQAKSGETVQHKPEVPWFIGLFILASVARTFIPQVVSWSSVITHVSEAGLTLTLFLIGAGLSQRMLKAVGWKPMVQGVVLWIFISATSLGVILLVVH